jgi:hypothetical protein
LVVLVACNLSLLSAMAAGRAESGSAGWALGLFAQLGTLAFALAISFATFGNRPSGTIIFSFGTVILGFLIAILLAFVEYAAFGRRSSFRADLRGSLWLGRFGIGRL